MAADLSPAFLFYVNDWRGSRRVQAMTFAERGMYLELLAEQWDSGAVPASPSACAARLGGKTREWTRAWPALEKCFVARPKDGLLINRKLESLRRDRLRFLKSQRESGLRGARRRWQADGEPIGSPKGRDKSPMAKNSLRSSNDLKGSKGKRREEEDDDVPSSPSPSSSPPDARSRRPIFKGARLVVFEWMVDDLRRLLGRHFDGFGLNEFFARLDRESDAADVEIPQRDGGQWLQARTLDEARRRGLTVADASSKPDPLARSILAPGTSTEELAASLKEHLDRKGRR